MQWAKEIRLCQPHKVCLLEHAVDIKELLTIPLPKCSGDIIFGALGRMTYQKGLDILIEAWRVCDSKKSARLIIGGVGPEERRLKKLAKGIDSIEFVGMVENREKFYQKCTCIVVPSRWEPYGQVCLEARAAARPVIVSNVDGLPEQIRNGTFGFVFRSRQSAELAARIDQMSNCIRTHDVFERMCLSARISAVDTRNEFLMKFSKLLTQGRFAIQADFT
jgi:glycosyltransferase involved in cell wall biosynthesis